MFKLFDTSDRSRALAKALRRVERKTLNAQFSEVVQEYKDVEKDFVVLAKNDAAYVLETRRRVAEEILQAAFASDQPFKVCRNCWNDLVALGFANIIQASFMSWYYASGCLEYNNIKTGLRVLKPVIKEFERLLADPNLSETAAWEYDVHITALKSLRDELEAPRP